MAKVAPEPLPKVPAGKDEASDLDIVGTVSKPLPRKKCLFEFSDTEAIKEKVRAAKFDKSKRPYDVKENYHETGFFQMIAKHNLFENCTLGVIIINAFWISVDTDGNNAETMLTAKPHFVVMDSLFFGYFLVEVFVRFMAFRKKCDCLKDGWFKFDFTLVALYAFDPFLIALVAHVQGGGGLDLPTSVLRLCRLARLSRLIRMLRSLPELMIMIKGMLTASLSVGYTLGLQMVITYVFAIAMRNLVPKAEVGVFHAATNSTESFWTTSEEECAAKFEGIGGDGCIETLFFSSVPEAMHNLMIFGTFLDDLSFYMWAVKMQSAPCLFLSWCYVSLASLTVMNMLIGVLCEVISAVAMEENETLMVDRVHEEIGSLMEQVDSNADGTLSWDEFRAVLEFTETQNCLERCSVDVSSLVDMAEDTFFEDGEPVSVSFEDFMSMVLDLRGGQQATVADILKTGKRFTQKVMAVTNRMSKVDDQLKAQNERMEQMDGKLEAILGLIQKRSSAA